MTQHSWNGNPDHSIDCEGCELEKLKLMFGVLLYWFEPDLSIFKIDTLAKIDQDWRNKYPEINPSDVDLNDF